MEVILGHNISQENKKRIEQIVGVKYPNVKIMEEQADAETWEIRKKTRKMKICILTQPLHTNYGALLQAYALQKVLRDFGHDVVTDRYGAKKRVSLLGRFLRFTHCFIRRYIMMDRMYNPYEYLFRFMDRRIKASVGKNTDRFIDTNISTIDFFNNRISPSKTLLSDFDALVVGSDQVWRSVSTYEAYLLKFTYGYNIKRIAYAASFGLDEIKEFSKDKYPEFVNSAKLFDSISVRENSGVNLCEKYFDVKATHVLDPTLLCDKDDYLKLIEKQDEHKRTNVLMCYILDKNDIKEEITKKVSSMLGLNVLEVMPKKLHVPFWGVDKDNIYPSVSSWLSGFRDAKFVITDSFHGTVFAIIFNKPFLSINNSRRGSTRFQSLLRIFNLENRLISSLSELTDENISDVDYSKVNSILEVWKENSLNFLKSNL